jgi:hypothetical protein
VTATLPPLSDTRVLLPVIDCPECVWNDFGARDLDWGFASLWSHTLHAAGAEAVREYLIRAWRKRGYDAELVCHHVHIQAGDSPVDVKVLHAVAQEAVDAVTGGELLARAGLESEYAEWMGERAMTSAIERVPQRRGAVLMETAPCTCLCVDPGRGWPDPVPAAYEPFEDCALHGIGAPHSAFPAEPADCPPGCTLSCCVPTQEQSAEVAEMLSKPMTFPIEDEEVPF